MSPRSSQQLDELREQRRDEILEAALELFASRGYHNTSIEQIRKKAGVSKGLIYNYFEKKEDLVTGIVMREMDMGEDIMQQIEDARNPKEQFSVMMDMAFDVVLKNEEHFKLIIALSLQLDLPEFAHLKQIIQGKYLGMMPFAEKLMLALGVPNHREEAQALTATLDGLALQRIILGETINLLEIKDFLIHKYCGEPYPRLNNDESPRPKDSHPDFTQNNNSTTDS